MAASSGLRQGCSSACTLCPSKAVQSVQSLPQLGIFVFVRRKRRAQCCCPSRPVTVLLARRPGGSLRLSSRSAPVTLSLHARFTHAPRLLRSGFRLLQPAPVNCRPLPQPQLGEHRPPHSGPSPRASLVWPVCSVWPSKAVQTLHPDQSDPQPPATIRHALDRPARWRWQSSRNKLPGSSSGSAAAAGAHHWITP